MRIVPKGLDERILFYELHIDVWEANAVELGLSIEQLAGFRAAIQAARGALDAAEVARQASLTATQALHFAVDTMHSDPAMGSSIINTIKAQAETTGDSNLYNTAELPPPQADTTPPPPSMPTNIRTALLPTGEVELTWKSSAPRPTQGTVYQIERAVDGDIDANIYGFVGISGQRRFIDETLPAGLARATYRITAIRGRTRSQTATHTVHFGVVREAPAISPASNMLGHRQRQAA